MNKANKLSQITEFAQVHISQAQPEQDPYLEFERLMHEGSIAKFESLSKRFEQIAGEGYGSCEIILDYTSEMFQMKEIESRFYSASEVVSMLSQAGFKITKTEDLYDAQVFTVVWHPDSKQFTNCIKMDI